jgi:hypothetical protein
MLFEIAAFCRAIMADFYKEMHYNYSNLTWCKVPFPVLLLASRRATQAGV